MTDDIRTPAPGNHVQVKPLEWRQGWKNSHVTILQADAMCGVYQVRTLDGVVWLDKPGSQTIYPSADEAKAAAQADHEARINEYLAHAPKDNVAGVDIPRLPIGTAVQKVGGYPFPGTVVATFHTLAGQERFVVEATGEQYAGMLHIFNGGQLRVTTEGQP